MPITIDNLRDFLRPGTDIPTGVESLLLEARTIQRDVAASQMCGGDDSDGDTLVCEPAHQIYYTSSITRWIKHPVSSVIGVVSQNSSWEGLTPMPYDAPAPVDNAAVAAKAETTEQKGKSLMSAIGAVQSQITSDGRPPRFTIVD